MENSVTRRNFVAGSAVAASAAFIAAFGKKAYAEAAEVPETWDLEADVVVIGFGGSGACAAVGASEAGASVILLEKANEDDAGGNFSVCGGGAVLANPDDPEMAKNFLLYQLPDTASEDEVETFVEESLATPDWLEEHDFDGSISWDDEGGGSMYPDNEYAHGFNGMVSGNGGGAGLYAWIKGIVDADSNIEVHYETPAVKLIFDSETKEVYGVQAMNADDEIVNVCAKKAVVMCCGGFENNHEMLTAYYPPEVPIYPCGTPYNTGDGVEMIHEIGAKQRGYGSVEWGCHCCKPASEEVGVACGLSFMGHDIWANAIMVNDQGERFVNEASSSVTSYPSVLRPLHDKSQLPELAFSMDTVSYTNLPMYMICDQSKIDAGAMFNACDEDATNHWAHIHDYYTWSNDNQDEIEKGWITKADTLEELAEQLGIDPDGLVATVEKYNAYCESGTDEDFGRTDALEPIATAPYYGCELGLGLINTQGGPVRNGKYQVIGYDDEPIARLYAGGEFGSMYQWLYQGAGNVAECLNSRGAGENAAAEEAWC